MNPGGDRDAALHVPRVLQPGWAARRPEGRAGIPVGWCEGLYERLGGRLIGNYWAFGSDDFIAIVEQPDDVGAAPAAMTVGASGVGSVTTTVLLTGGQADEARGRRAAYRAPGA